MNGNAGKDLVFEEKGLLALEHSDPRLSPRVLRYAAK